MEKVINGTKMRKSVSCVLTVAMLASVGIAVPASAETGVQTLNFADYAGHLSNAGYISTCDDAKSTTKEVYTYASDVREGGIVFNMEADVADAGDYTMEIYGSYLVKDYTIEDASYGYTSTLSYALNGEETYTELTYDNAEVKAYNYETLTIKSFPNGEIPENAGQPDDLYHNPSNDLIGGRCKSAKTTVSLQAGKNTISVMVNAMPDVPSMQAVLLDCVKIYQRPAEGILVSAKEATEIPFWGNTYITSKGMGASKISGQKGGTIYATNGGWNEELHPELKTYIDIQEAGMYEINTLGRFAIGTGDTNWLARVAVSVDGIELNGEYNRVSDLAYGDLGLGGNKVRTQAVYLAPGIHELCYTMTDSLDGANMHFALDCIHIKSVSIYADSATDGVIYADQLAGAGNKSMPTVTRTCPFTGNEETVYAAYDYNNSVDKIDYEFPFYIGETGYYDISYLVGPEYNWTGYANVYIDGSQTGTKIQSLTNKGSLNYEWTEDFGYAKAYQFLPNRYVQEMQYFEAGKHMMKISFLPVGNMIYSFDRVEITATDFGIPDGKAELETMRNFNDENKTFSSVSYTNASNALVMVPTSEAQTDKTYRTYTAVVQVAESGNYYFELGAAGFSAGREWLSPISVSIGNQDLGYLRTPDSVTDNFVRADSPYDTTNYPLYQFTAKQVVPLEANKNYIVTFKIDSRVNNSYNGQNLGYNDDYHAALDYFALKKQTTLTNPQAKLSDTIAVGEAANITVSDNEKTITAADVYQMTFKSSNENVVTVDGTGLVTAQAAGNAQITVEIIANMSDDAISLYCPITVTDSDVYVANAVVTETGAISFDVSNVGRDSYENGVVAVAACYNENLLTEVKIFNIGNLYSGDYYSYSHQFSKYTIDCDVKIMLLESWANMKPILDKAVVR